jgi:hypothetical protein
MSRRIGTLDGGFDRGSRGGGVFGVGVDGFVALG